MDKATAEAVKDAIIAALPEKIELSHVSYDDGLSEDQVEKIIDGNFDFVEESIDEWESENRHYGIDFVLESIGADRIVEDAVDDDDEITTFEEFANEFRDHAEEIRETIEERDESDLFGGMLRNTFDMVMKWEANAEDPEHRLWLDEDSDREDADRICRFLHINSKYAPDLWELRESGIGTIGIMWYASVDDVVHVSLADQWENTDKSSAATTIRWADKCHVYIDDAYYNGTLQIEGGAKVRCDLGTFGLDTNSDWHKPAFTGRYSIVDTMEDYTKDLVDFYQYRAKILEGTRG